MEMVHLKYHNIKASRSNGTAFMSTPHLNWCEAHRRVRAWECHIFELASYRIVEDSCEHMPTSADTSIPRLPPRLPPRPRPPHPPPLWQPLPRQLQSGPNHADHPG